MLCRKHLQNAQILSVKQVGFERIIAIEFLSSSDFSDYQTTLYCEIMGKYSNLILVQNGVILGALKTTSLEENAKRILFSGAKYVLPEPQGKANPLNLGELESVMQNKGADVAKFICANVEGIAYSTALEMENFYGEDITAQNIYDFVNGESQPCVVYKNGEPCDFKVRSLSINKKEYPTLLQAQSEYYSHVYLKKTFEAQKRKLESALSSKIKKCEKKIALMEQKLFECDEAEEIKLKGELITANIYRIERGMEGIEVINYYDENAATLKIALDKTLTPAQNAQKHYKKYAKLKRTIENVGVQLTQAEEELNYLNSIKSSIYAAELIIDLKEIEEELIDLGFIKSGDLKKKKKEVSPYRVYEYNGFKIIAGRNNAQNDRLTKSLNADDVWLHTQKYHSSHVAIICNGNKIPDDVLGVAAEICAYYSDGRNGSKIPVDYSLKKYVKKPPQKALGFFIYTDYKTVLVNPNNHKDKEI
ncbi:MAG: NFACT family protein [Clostridia bacterium]|nr:NFACT family protein [Clostridia bacterium]